MKTTKWAFSSLLIFIAAVGIGVGSGIVPLEKIPAINTIISLVKPASPTPKAVEPSAEKEIPAADSSIEKANKDSGASPSEFAKKAAPIVPAFDILRVEKTGDVLVAGRAAPNSSIELLSPDGTVLGRSRTGGTGDFVIILESRLPAGNHELVLRAVSQEGQSILSAETGLVHIPERAEDEVLAMVTEDGKASRVLTAPTPVAASDPVKVEMDIVVEVEPIEPVEPAIKETAKIVASVETIVEDVSKTLDAEIVPATANVSKSDVVTVEAVEVEGENIFVAGSVKQGSSVRVYIDNQPLGLTRGTSDDRFLLERKFNLKKGEHSVRADVVSGAGGQVIARAEVPLFHQTTVPEPQVIALVEPEVQTSKTESETDLQIAEVPDVANNTTGSVIRTGSTIIIKPGDNLWRISRKTYGRGIRYTTIYNANRDQIRNPSRIYIGQVFKLPTNADQPVSEE